MGGIDTDDQVIDSLNLNGSTLEISLEDDAQDVQTVDLSSLNTDNQTVDTFLLKNTVLRLSLEDDNEPSQEVDLARINTDDQVVDTLTLNGTVLEISLEGDEENVRTVDLSPLSATQTLLADADEDTKVEVEASPDEDAIRFTLAGTEHFIIEKNASDMTLLNIPGIGRNVLLGNSAGLNTTGPLGKNTYIGTEAGRDNTSGASNVAIGDGASLLNTTGFGNVAVGVSAGGQNTNAHNVFVGRLAGEANTNGEGNVFIGSLAGRRSDGSDNVFIGANAGENTTGDNKLIIDNPNTSAPLIYGEFDNGLLRINGSLQINEQYTFPTTQGADGQILKTDGSGNLTWQDDNNSGAVKALIEDVDQDTKIQVEESADEDIIRFDADGVEVARFLSSGHKVLMVPSRDVLSLGSEETGVGGSQNTFIGHKAARPHISGIQNTALGRSAMLLHERGNNNTAIGAYSLREGIDNHGNTALGMGAGRNTLGSYNLFLGHRAGYNEAGSEKLYIANSDTGSPLIYGEFDNDLLRVNGTLDINNAYQFPTTSGAAGQILKTDGAGNLSWENDNNTDSVKSLITDDDGDTKIESESTPDDDIIRFTVQGDELMFLQKNDNDEDFVVIDAKLDVSPGTDTLAHIGHTIIGIRGLSNSSGFSHESQNNNQSYAVLQGGAGTTYVNAPSGQSVRLRNNNVDQVEVNATQTIIKNDLKVGTNGSPIASIIKSTQIKDVSNINSNSTEVVDFIVTGAQEGSVVMISPQEDLGSRIVIGQTWVSGPGGRISMKLRNVGGSGQNPPSMAFDIIVFN